MADDLSVQLLAFNFGSRTYAYKYLAQGLSKSVTGFSSFIRHYLDPCLTADLCTQFMDDIGSAVNNFQDLTPTLQKIFECIRRSGLTFSPKKCEIGTQRMKFLGNIVTPMGVSPEKVKISAFLDKIKMPQAIKQVKRLIGYVQFFRNYMPSLGEKLIPFYRLLKKSIYFEITAEHYKSLEVLKKDLIRATNLTLKLPEPGLQYVILCDASNHETGFVLMVEDYIKTDKKGGIKTYAPVPFGSRLFNPAQLKFSIYYKEFLALYFALDHFSHYIWGSVKPVIWLTDNRSLTQYFQAKTIRPSVWNFLDRVLSFNIIIAGIPGTANCAADFLPRMQTDPSASLSLKLTDKVPVREIYIDSTARVPDASLNQVQAIEDAFSTNEEIDDNLIANLQRFGLYQAYLEKQNGKNGNEGLEPKALVHLIRKTVKYPDPAELYNDLPLNSEPLNLKAEQQKDPDVENVKNWMRIGETPDLTYANSRLKKYAKQFNRLIIEDEILFRNFYDDTGNIKHKQYCLPTHLWNEVIYRIHNSPTGGHIGMTRTNEEFRKRFYFPGFTEFLVNTNKNCLTCLQVKNASSKHQTPPLQPFSSLQSFPGYMMQIDIVGPFKSPVYKLPTHLWNEVIYRIHNSPTGGHIGMTRTNEEFRKRFYFPGFTEFLVNTIKNCLTCLQVKNASNKHQTPPLQPLSSLQSFPGYMMQVDIVGPFKSPVYKFVLTGIDVFSKYLFSAPLTNASADSVARELTKCSLCTATSLNEFCPTLEVLSRRN